MQQICISFSFYGIILRAPSKRITSPFIILLLTTCSTRAAYSSGYPSLDGQGTFFAKKFRTFSGNEAKSGESKRPGEFQNVKSQFFIGVSDRKIT